MAHNYAGCAVEPCGTCAAYGDGYSDGKDKAYFEIDVALDEANHAAGCGCRPCATVRAVLERGKESR